MLALRNTRIQKAASQQFKNAYNTELGVRVDQDDRIMMSRQLAYKYD